MKAIETEYSGVRFRSRLEARWAVFFDALGIRWEYEPEAFRLADGSGYLPDFWVVNDVTSGMEGGGAFIEVKPDTGGDDFKARAFSKESDRTIFIVRGEPTIDRLHSHEDGCEVPPYPFGYDAAAYRRACATARAHRFWNPREARH